LKEKCISPTALANFNTSKAFYQELDQTLQSVPEAERRALQREITNDFNALSTDEGQVVQKTITYMTKLTQLQQQSPDRLFKCACFFISKSFASQATTQVAGNPVYSTALPYAVVLRTLCTRFPLLEKAIICSMHNICPYTLPFCPKRSLYSHLNNSQYQREILKYRPNEDDASYSIRMRGVCCAYTTFLAPNLGYLPTKTQELWTWLARLLNNQEISDLTADIILIILKIAGHDLLNQYKGQFRKILSFLQLEETYAQRIPGNSKIRLDNFIRGYQARNQIERPQQQQ